MPNTPQQTQIQHTKKHFKLQVGGWGDLSWTEEQQRLLPANRDANDGKRMWKQRDWEGGGRQQDEDNFLLLEPLEGSTFKPPVSIVCFAGPPSCLLCVSSLLCLVFSQVGECFLVGITSLGKTSVKVGILSQPPWLRQNPNLSLNNKSQAFFVQHAPSSSVPNPGKEGQGAIVLSLF